MTEIITVVFSIILIIMKFVWYSIKKEELMLLAVEFDVFVTNGTNSC